MKYMQWNSGSLSGIKERSKENSISFFVSKLQLLTARTQKSRGHPPVWFLAGLSSRLEHLILLFKEINICGFLSHQKETTQPGGVFRPLFAFLVTVS